MLASGLNDARKLASSKLEQSRLSTYFGHLQRLDGDVESAARHYREALKLDPENRDAARWVRHYSRQSDKDKGGLFSKLFQGKTKK